MKVNVYDIAQVLTEIGKSEFNAASPKYLGENYAVLVGADKVIVTDNEAVHVVENRAGKVLGIPVEYLITKATPVDEVELGIFVRRFGARIEGNYIGLLKSIQEIGLNPADYPRKIDLNPDDYPRDAK